MNTFIDHAIILNVKENSAANVIVSMFCREHGKLNVLAYNFRNSKKRQLSSLMPLSVSEVEILEKNESYTVQNSYLKNNYTLNIKNIYKLNSLIYVINVLYRLIELGFADTELYDKILEILEYIKGLDDKVLDRKFSYYLAIAYLRRLMVILGFYDAQMFANNLYIKDAYNKFVDFTNDTDKASVSDLESLLEFFESYINNYFGVKLDYKKIFI